MGDEKLAAKLRYLRQKREYEETAKHLVEQGYVDHILDRFKGSQKDLWGKPCPSCKRGKLKELTIQDDWDGKLTCDRCASRFCRHSFEEIK